MTPRLMREGRVTGAASVLLDGQLVLLAMIGPHRLDHDLPPDEGLQLLEALALARLQVMGHLRVDADHHVPARALLALRLDLAKDLRGEGGVRLDHAAALAGRTRGAVERLQALPDALAGHLDQA